MKPSSPRRRSSARTAAMRPDAAAPSVRSSKFWKRASNIVVQLYGGPAGPIIALLVADFSRSIECPLPSQHSFSRQPPAASLYQDKGRPTFDEESTLEGEPLHPVDHERRARL